MRHRHLATVALGLILAACSQPPDITAPAAQGDTPTATVGTSSPAGATPSSGASAAGEASGGASTGGTSTAGDSAAGTSTSASSSAGGASAPAPVTPMTGSEFEASASDAAEANRGLDSLAPGAGLDSAALRATSGVNTSGSVLAGGQPIFPMGFYHESWAGDAARRTRDMNAIADLGMNTMTAAMFDPEGDLPAFTTFLRAASARGMRVLVEDASATSVGALKAEPGLLGWMIADDSNTTVSAAQLLSRQQSRKAQDAAHLTYASLAVSYNNTHAAYFGKSDLMGNQSYPVGGGDEIGAVYGTMQLTVKEARSSGTAPIANLQSFRWPDGRYPTPAQLYNMTGQALAAGVKGILYYTYLDQANDLTTQAPLLDQLRRVSGEVRQLSPVLLGGQLTTLASGSAQAHASLWSYQGRRYLEVLSVNEQAPVSVKLALAGASELRPLFAGRPTGLRLQAGVATGTLSALAVHWYEVR